MFRLATHLGKSLREVEALDSREVTEWLAYEDVNGPLGQERLDYLAGLVAATAVNVWKGKEERPLGPLDLVEDWGGQRAKAEEARREEERRHEAEAMRLWGAVRMTVGQGV